MIIIQHPYGESDEDKVTEALSTGPGAYVGYFGPFKSADVLGAALDMEPVMVPRNDDRHKVLGMCGVWLEAGLQGGRVPSCPGLWWG
jgi:hypothetical protein